MTRSFVSFDRALGIHMAGGPFTYASLRKRLRSRRESSSAVRSWEKKGIARALLTTERQREGTNGKVSLEARRFRVDKASSSRNQIAAKKGSEQKPVQPGQCITQGPFADHPLYLTFDHASLSVRVAVSADEGRVR